MLPTYTLLFNYVYNNGIVPESWTTGIIKPVYKNKGSIEDPNNYRTLTILSCFGKLFTSVLNKKLSDYLENDKTIGEEQLGFRSGYSTIDGVFILNSLQTLLKSQKKNLFCAFIDLKKCFGSIWRDGLWHKLNKLKLGVKMTRVIKSMYNNIKSKISLTSLDENNTIVCNESQYFSCEKGLREGEILSPILFSLYVNDLNKYFEENHCQGVNISSKFYDELIIYAKLFLVMYADDTVLFATNRKDLQKSLNIYSNYCDKWKLDINIEKTKVLCFGRKRHCHFFINNKPINIVDDFKYLGVVFTKNGRLINAIKENIRSATKALHSLWVSFREKNIPLDCQLELAEKIIEPILLYGSEVWGYENFALIEQFRLKYLKNITKVRQSTPNYMVYGETGTFPLSVKIKIRMIKFWKRLVTGKTDKISFQIYRAMLNDQITNNKGNYTWLNAIKNIFTETGCYHIWLEQYLDDTKVNAISRILRDQAIQHLNASCSNSNKGRNYTKLKTSWGTLPNIYNIKHDNLISLIKFRTSNHRLPVEVGRYNDTPFHERRCPFCVNSLGDEYHYIMECNHFKRQRKLYIKEEYFIRPSMAKYLQMMSSKNVEILDKMGKFSAIIIKSFNR